MSLDNVDRELLDLLQNNFPIAAAPYAIIGEKLGIDESDIINRIKTMKENGLIRRIGAVIDSRRMGMYSTLCAMEVPEADLESVASRINQLSGVTHNYQRDHKYNIWFTLTASSPDEAESRLKELEASLGYVILNMPATKVYKIKVAFNMGGTNEIG